MARPDNKKPRTSRWKKVRIAVLLALVPGLLGLAFVHWPLTAWKNDTGSTCCSS